MKKLVFIYNANSSLFSTVTDTVHKVLSPSTYACNLCKITYGTLSMKNDWREFIKSLPVKVEFLHKDESLKKYPQFTSFPMVALIDGEQVSLFISSEQINQAKSIEDLKNLIKNSLNNNA